MIGQLIEKEVKMANKHKVELIIRREMPIFSYIRVPKVKV